MTNTKVIKAETFSINSKLVTVTNNALKRKLSAMSKADTAERSSSWAFAIALNDSINGKLFKDDFDNEKEFCKALGITESLKSQYKGACKFLSEHPKAIEHIRPSRAYLFSTVSDYADFTNFANSNGLPLDSDKSVKEAIKAYKKKDSAIDTNATIKASEDAKDESINDESVAVKNFTDVSGKKAIMFEFDGIVYRIPVKDLKKYIVSEAETE